jgi:small subunit ribosomal protein S6
MVRYEALMLTVPEITADEVKTIESQLDRVVKESKGTVVSFERWGKFRLSYPVKKNEYGVYFLVRFEAEASHPLVENIEALLSVKLHELIMRNMVSRLDSKASLAYSRPQSLEEAPVQQVGSFFADRKGDDNQGASMHDDEDNDFARAA